MKNRADPEHSLIKLFGSMSRARILSFLYAHAEQSFYQREIMLETGLSLRPVQRELNNLITLGIVKKQEERNRVYYRINGKSLLCKPLGKICGMIGEEGGA